MQPRDKVVVVTGGGSGIGRALVLRLVQVGARVAAVDIDGEALQETRATARQHGQEISLHVVNVSDRSAVEALPAEVLDAHGAVDGLINNAGIIQPFVRLDDLAHEAIERVQISGVRRPGCPADESPLPAQPPLGDAFHVQADESFVAGIGCPAPPAAGPFP